MYAVPIRSFMHRLTLAMLQSDEMHDQHMCIAAHGPSSSYTSQIGSPCMHVSRERGSIAFKFIATDYGAIIHKLSWLAHGCLNCVSLY